VTGVQTCALPISGGSDESLKEGSQLKLTQSALVLENLIGQFLASSSNSSKDDKLADALGKLADSLSHNTATPAAGATP
jgi:phospholipid/cholesterol/gamma-HCH transport system substrate-binding protein